MQAITNYSQEDVARMEIYNFVNDGLEDVYHNRLVDFDCAFNDLEERYHADA